MNNKNNNDNSQKAMVYSTMLAILTILATVITISKPIVDSTNESVRQGERLERYNERIEQFVENTMANNEILWNHVNKYTPVILENEKLIFNLDNRVSKLEGK